MALEPKQNLNHAIHVQIYYYIYVFLAEYYVIAELMNIIKNVNH